MKYLVSVFLLLCSINLDAGFSNNGKFQSKNLNIAVSGTLENNGELIGSESINLGCDLLSGHGLIQAPIITIKAKTFAYAGTIHCKGKCMIIASAPFDEKKFNKVGGGEFLIVIDPTLEESHHRPVKFDYEFCEVE